jgi:hypothetical protein
MRGMKADGFGDSQAKEKEAKNVEKEAKNAEKEAKKAKKAQEDAEKKAKQDKKQAVSFPRDAVFLRSYTNTDTIIRPSRKSQSSRAFSAASSSRSQHRLLLSTSSNPVRSLLFRLPLRKSLTTSTTSYPRQAQRV